MTTYWNGYPCKARKVVVKMGRAERPTWWCAGMEGTIRKAVEVTSWDGKPFVIDNESGEGWDKVTLGKGSPFWPHSSITNYEIVGED